MHSARLDVSEGEPLGKEQSVFNVVATSGVSHRRKKITIFQSHWVRQRVFFGQKRAKRTATQCPQRSDSISVVCEVRFAWYFHI